MRNYFIIILLTLCAHVAHSGDTKIKFIVRGDLSFTPTVDIGFGKESINYDPIKGIGELTLYNTSPMTIYVEVSRNSFRTIYVSQGADMVITVDNSTKPVIVTYEGDNVNENSFMNGIDFYSRKLFPANKKSDIKEVSRFIDSLLSVNLSELIRADDLSKEFHTFEAKNQKTKAYTRFLRECRVTENNAELFLSELSQRVSDESLSVNNHEYRCFMRDAVKRIPSIKNPRMKDSERTKMIVETILNEVPDRETKAYLIDVFITPHISFAGVSGADYFIDIFNQYVTNPARIANFKRIRALSEIVNKGKPCPDFTFNDVNGKSVSLSDLRGNYVLIDLWATWCGPCKAEIPYMHKLEEEFAGKDITFVSISVDKNKDIKAWKDMVKENKMGGIQLILGENWNWVKNFMPTSLSVPRFILLDKNGIIVDPNFTRPSDINTAKFLSNLLKN